MSSQRNINYPCVGAARLPRSAHICPKLIKPWADKPLMNILLSLFYLLRGDFFLKFRKLFYNERCYYHCGWDVWAHVPPFAMC